MPRYTTFLTGPQRPAGIEAIREQCRDSHLRMPPPEPPPPQMDAASRLFTIRTGQQWIEGQRHVPAPRPLFGPFWTEGELCLLFADTNMGKSVLAVQLGNAIAWGQPTGGPFGMDVTDAGVLYLDFELSARQFELRYPDAHNRSIFSRRFFRAELNAAGPLPPGYATLHEYMAAGISHALLRTGARVLIVDNLACLQRNTGTAGGALPLMQYLNTLKHTQRLSILVLAHTPKRRPHQPLTQNDLQGSKLLMNFADSAFAIGASPARPGHRYLKQVKQRNGEEVYGAGNVCLCKLTQQGGVLRYEAAGEAPESEHLHRRVMTEASLLHEQICTLRAQRYTQRQIAAELQVSVGLVNKVLNK